MKRTGILSYILILASIAYGQLVADHTSTDLGSISLSAVEAAKAQFRIWYGHTSHGSQITSGMSVLAADDPVHFNYNSTGSGGALSYQETGGDLGHNGDLTWEVATRAQLNRPDNDRNVVVWSWCGGVSDNTVSGINTYLNAMNQLELDYPHVLFIYMTGHLDGTGESGNLNLRNNQIRQYCQANGKILFDFADIESFDPDGSYFLDLDADDGCNYWVSGSQYNWADEWCAANPGQCSSVSCAHSRSLNCDRKGVAFWWLLAQLADQDICTEVPGNVELQLQTTTSLRLTWTHTQADSFIIQRRFGSQAWNLSYATIPGTLRSFDDTGLADGTYQYRVVAHLNDDGNGQPCDSSPSSIAQGVIATQPPMAPTQLAVSYDGASVQLTWTDNADNEQGFIVERDTDGAGFVEIAQIGANQASWSDTNVNAGMVLTYRIFAWNQNGPSGTSNEATLTVPNESFTVRLETTDEVDDAFLDSLNPDSNYGATPYVSTMERFVIMFHLPEALLGNTILEARLAFYGWGQSNWQPDQFLDLYRITQYWEEPTVTWNQACDCAIWTTPGGAFDSTHPLGQIPITENCDHCFYPEIDITELVQVWADGCQDNLGSCW